MLGLDGVAVDRIRVNGGAQHERLVISVQVDRGSIVIFHRGKPPAKGEEADDEAKEKAERTDYQRLTKLFADFIHTSYSEREIRDCKQVCSINEAKAPYPARFLPVCFIILDYTTKKSNHLDWQFAWCKKSARMQVPGGAKRRQAPVNYPTVADSSTVTWSRGKISSHWRHWAWFLLAITSRPLQAGQAVGRGSFQEVKSQLG